MDRNKTEVPKQFSSDKILLRTSDKFLSESATKKFKIPTALTTIPFR